MHTVAEVQALQPVGQRIHDPLELYVPDRQDKHVARLEDEHLEQPRRH